MSGFNSLRARNLALVPLPKEGQLNYKYSPSVHRGSTALAKKERKL